MIKIQKTNKKSLQVSLRHPKVKVHDAQFQVCIFTTRVKTFYYNYIHTSDGLVILGLGQATHFGYTRNLGFQVFEAQLVAL